jgi:hypothetical protein
MLGEKVSTEITKKEDKQGFIEVKDAAKRGGKVAGNARKETEQELNQQVISQKNFLKESENIKMKKTLKK